MCKEIKASVSVKLVTVVNYAKLTPVRTDIASMVEHVKSLEQLQHVLANQATVDLIVKSIHAHTSHVLTMGSVQLSQTAPQ